MALNLWRYCEYTDDGCARYQCLKCYGTWEGRGCGPGYYEYDPPHNYVVIWRFCPVCGTQWDGPLHKPGEDQEYYYGPRRKRVWEAMRKAWSSRPYVKTEPRFTWVAETRATWRNSPPGEWTADWRDENTTVLDGLLDPQQVLDRFRMTQAECIHRNGEEGDDPIVTWEARLVLVRPNRPTMVVKSPE